LAVTGGFNDYMECDNLSAMAARGYSSELVSPLLYITEDTIATFAADCCRTVDMTTAERIAHILQIDAIIMNVKCLVTARTASDRRCT